MRPETRRRGMLPLVNPETITCDADFALVVSGVTGNFSVRGGDWNGDGRTDAIDCLEFLSDFFRGEADFDQNGRTASADVFAFLDALFAARE